MFSKYFTLEEANNHLPLIKKVVADILENNTKIKKLIGNTRLTDKAELIEECERRIVEFVNELEGLGCFYETTTLGLGVVEFPGFLSEQCVLWSWRSDEESVELYHLLEEDWQQRKSIPQVVSNKIQGL
ncbi:MAG: hypothetical protein ACI9F2_000820 [Lysobacterales bacterium]|jgi:hypothetical protein